MYIKRLDEFFVPSYTPSSCIQIPKTLAHYEIDPDTIQMLSTFHGEPHEDPYQHLDDFLEICSIIHIQDLPNDALKLILFPFSLKDRAKTWLRSIGKIITTWKDLEQEFLKKFFPIGLTNSFRRAITGFLQFPDEKFHESWERFQGLLRRCRHHGFQKWQIVQSFYDGLTESNKRSVDMSCGGDFMSKNEDEAYSLFENLSENSSNHEASLLTHDPVTQSEGIFNPEHPRVNSHNLTPNLIPSSLPHHESCAFCASPTHPMIKCHAFAQLPPFIQAQLKTACTPSPHYDFYNYIGEDHSTFSYNSHDIQVPYPPISSCQNWSQI